MLAKIIYSIGVFYQNKNIFSALKDLKKTEFAFDDYLDEIQNIDFENCCYML